MDGMQFPQDRDPMKSPVSPVLCQIRDRHGAEKLDRPRYRLHARNPALKSQLFTEPDCWGERRERAQMDADGAHQEVGAIGGPPRSKSALRDWQRPASLQGN